MKASAIYRVYLKGIAAFDSSDALQKVVTVESLEVQKNYDLVKRFDELGELQNGWLTKNAESWPKRLDKLSKLQESGATYQSRTVSNIASTF